MRDTITYLKEIQAYMIERLNTEDREAYELFLAGSELDFDYISYLKHITKAIRALEQTVGNDQ